MSAIKRTKRRRSQFMLICLTVMSGFSIVGCDNDGSANETAISATLTAVVPTSTPVLSDGYERHQFADGRSIDLPAGWVVMTLDAETIAGLGSGAAELAPEVVDLFGGAGDYEEFIAAGMEFMAFDLDGGTFDFTPNLSIIAEEGVRLSLENYVRLSKANLNTAGVSVLDDESATLNGKSVRIVHSRFSSPALSYDILQYIWIESRTAWIVSMALLPEERDKYRRVVDLAVGSIQ